MLQEMVAAGELPPLEERLPMNPFVSESLDGIGNYGGALRRTSTGEADTWSRGQVVSRGLTNINHELTLHAFMAESYEVSDDATEWTFHLRKGLKWSDGEPMTSEDFRFYYEDVALNRDLTPAHPAHFSSIVEGERIPAEFSAPDEYTIVFKFDQPNGLLHYKGPIVCNSSWLTPMHFLKDYHPDYADADELSQMVADAQLNDWTELFLQKDNPNETPERPTHEPWVNKNPYADEVTIIERNPYFWEVDPEGNQLPYIDQLQYREALGPEVALMRAINGEVDCSGRHQMQFANYTVLKENESNGDYTVQVWPQTGTYISCFNMNAKNENLARLFKERDFRIAISLAPNREEMNELLWEGFGRPQQFGPSPESPMYNPNLAEAYLDYDPDRANELLDGLGYISDRDEEGYRLFEDGTRVSFECTGGVEPEDFHLLLIDYLKEIGLEMRYNGVERTRRNAMYEANEYEMIAGMMRRCLVPLADLTFWTKSWDRPYAQKWVAWYTRPELPIAERPPEDHWIWELWRLDEAIQKEPDREKQIELFKQIEDLWAEELPMQGYCGGIPRCVIVKNGLMGVHPKPWDCCVTVYEHIIDNATWYWDKPEEHEL
jgi:peptide/nickel transport system substrate-binding protein